MTNDTRIVLGCLALVLGWSIYSHTTLSDEVAQAQQIASICHCPQSGADQHNAVRLNELTRHSVASHSYFEHLLEGLVRRNGLSLDAARKAFTEGMEPYGGLPQGWRWLKAWETTP